MIRAVAVIRAVVAIALGLSAAGVAGASSLRQMTDRSHQFGWEAVGRLELDGRGYCTAVLIAPDLVLTAAHCLFAGEADTRLDPAGMTFGAGYRDGETIATASVARAVVSEEFDPDDPDFLRFLRNDVALLQLAERIPATTASPYAVALPKGEGSRVTVISYGASRMNAASRQSGCRTVVQTRGVAGFDCDGEPGSSGAPIFDTSGHAPRIVSMISSGGPYQGRDVVFGTELPTAVADLKHRLRAGLGVWPSAAPADARRIVRGGDGAGRTAGGARFLRP